MLGLFAKDLDCWSRVDGFWLDFRCLRMKYLSDCKVQMTLFMTR